MGSLAPMREPISALSALLTALEPLGTVMCPYRAGARTIRAAAVHTVDSQTRGGGNVAVQLRSGIDWGELSALLTPRWLGRQGTAGPLRRFPRRGAGGASHARIARRGGKRRLRRQSVLNA